VVHNKCSKITVLYLKKKVGAQKENFEFLNFFFKMFSSNFWIFFWLFLFFAKCSPIWLISGPLQNVHLYGLSVGHYKMFTYMAYQWAITKLSYMYFISKRDPNSEISHNWKIHKFFIFHPFLCVFLFFELIVLRVSTCMSIDFLYLLKILR
jgi:hypothetical protein